MRWIIGDIHGMLKPLHHLLQAVERLDAQAQFIFLGDYVNRGPESRAVVDLLLALPSARFLRGNHDDVFDLILHGQCYYPGQLDGISAFKWFYEHGLDKTLASYGVSPSQVRRIFRKSRPSDLQDALEVIPASHRAFFRGLGAVLEEPDAFIAHAHWSPNTPSNDMARRLDGDPRRRHDVLWGRFSEHELLAEKAWDRPGYFGHTAVVNYRSAMQAGKPIPVLGEKIVLLDTGVSLGPWGRLTAWCIETGRYVQCDTEGKLIEDGS